jgi:hypothetical protein
MNKGVDITFTSPDMLRLQKTFQNLRYIDQRKVLISAFRKATKPVLNQIKANAPRGATGNLKKSIGLLVSRNEISVILGARKRKGFKGYHGHLVEDGTKDRYVKTWRGKPLKKKRYTGRMDSGGSYAGYFKRAIDSKGDGVHKTLGTEWYKAIQKFHEKHGLR